MLSALHIQDFLLIEQLSVPLNPGLTALTGETGAGKSILLDALGLACGGRAERGAVRHGAKQGIVTVAFEPGSAHPVWQVLEDNGLAIEGEDQIILRRIQSVDGRGRGFVNDQPVSITMLRTIGEQLLEIHGQHDGRGFLSASAHMALLDEFGGHTDLVLKVQTLWRQWREAFEQLEIKKKERDQNLREADYLRHVAEELTQLAPAVEEETRLAQERSVMMASEQIGEELFSAHKILDDDGLEDKIARSLRHLEAAARRGQHEEIPIAGAIEKVEIAHSAVMEARAVISELTERVESNPKQLSEIEERLFALRAAARKHAVTPDGLVNFFEKVTLSLEELDAGEVIFDELEKTLLAARSAYYENARALSVKRQKTAQSLDDAVALELAPLKLDRAVFSTQIKVEEDNGGLNGIDHVEFMVATNPGAPPGPLKSIASGGELSRFVLAMKAALSAKESRTVIIFDEVDAGVGGAVADAVGERLAKLARDTQVLVVTHSPQVAARAQSQWEIKKDQRKNETVTHVKPLENDDRIEELARMLSGAVVTDEARAAAIKLIKGGGASDLKTAKNPRKSTKKATAKFKRSSVHKKAS